MPPSAVCSDKDAVRVALPDIAKLLSNFVEQSPCPWIVAREENESEQKQRYARKKWQDYTCDAGQHRQPSQYQK
jgi:hypothetical protein